MSLSCILLLQTEKDIDLMKFEEKTNKTKKAFFVHLVIIVILTPGLKLTKEKTQF